MCFSGVLGLFPNKSIVPVWLPDGGQQVTSWLSWKLCFCHSPSPREEEDVNRVAEKEEGMAHRIVMVT